MKLNRTQLRKLILKEFLKYDSENVNYNIPNFKIDIPGLDIGSGNLPPKEPVQDRGGGGEEPCYSEDSNKFQKAFNNVLNVYSSIFSHSDAIYDFLEENGVGINYDHPGPGAGDMERNMIMALSRDLCLGSSKGGISSNELTLILLDANRLIEYINPEYLL